MNAASDASAEPSGLVHQGLPHLQTTVPGPGAAAPQNDGNGVDSPGRDAGAIERARAAVADTVAQHLAGKLRGKAVQTPASVAGVPVDSVGNGAVATPGQVDGRGDSAEDLADEGETFTDEFFAAGSELVVDSLEDAKALLMEFYALHQLGSVDKAAAAAEKIRGAPQRLERMRKSVARLAKQNPERAAKLFAWLLWWDPAIWFGDTIKQFNAVKAAGERLRSAAAPAAPASAPSASAPAPAASPATTVIAAGPIPEFSA